MKVEAKYHKSFRFCNYLGRYFCTGCHENQGAIIPARVIYHWDFKKYPVSNFSLDILNSMAKEPLFNIHEQNPTMLRKIEKLKQVALARTQGQDSAFKTVQVRVKLSAGSRIARKHRGKPGF